VALALSADKRAGHAGYVGIGFTFLPHVIVPDKRHGVHC
jgi:hypothetical protein